MKLKPEEIGQLNLESNKNSDGMLREKLNEFISIHSNFDKEVGGVIVIRVIEDAEIWDREYVSSANANEVHIMFTHEEYLSTVEPYNRMSSSQYIGFAFAQLQNMKLSNGDILFSKPYKCNVSYATNGGSDKTRKHFFILGDKKFEEMDKCLKEDIFPLMGLANTDMQIVVDEIIRRFFG